MSLLTESTHSTHSNQSSRFSLILLEPGEIYFEDYLVYYHELKCPFNYKTQPQQTDEHSIKNIKGNIKICSKSIVFDPINLNYPLLKFQFKSIEKIEQFDESDADEEDIYSSRNFFAADKPKDKLVKKCFAISVKQVTKCKVNNKIGPYTTVKRESLSDKHYFQFIFTDVNDSLDLMRQLHRASTLDFEQEDIMLQLILNSRLSKMAKFDLNHLDDLAREQIQFESTVYKINPLVANPGKIILSNMCLYYKPFNNLDSEKKILKIKLKNIKFVIKRRYHLKKVGCEIIFDDDSFLNETNETNQTTITNSKRMPYLYLTFEDEMKRDLFYTRLVVDQKEKLINLNNFSQENMLQKWRFGVISNYEYLMYLNNIADRSFNDLTQYPVYPWVLKDYTSETIDLTDPDSFRDLSKPIGAQNPERLARLRQRCKEMSATTTGFSKEEKSEQPVFLYGSHYSTPAFVSFYLVREYPEWQLCLQNGRFDHANRLFHCIADTWKNCLSIDSDVKELIPEFYDTDSLNRRKSFLSNYQELDLGIRQDNVRVNHVILPKWCSNSHEFIQIMRDALESDYVSENLHKWIDLIFGYKQRGEEALKADNLFYYLCYEGGVDLDSIKNYSERKSLEIQIQEFGQIPSLLFTSPHLPRVKKADLIQSSIVYNSDEVGDSFSSLNLENENKNENLNQEINLNKSEPQYPVINVTNFDQLKVKFNIKLHKGQVNDCLFIEHTAHNDEDTSKDSKFKLPLVCSVSNDNWMKIYSLDDRSLFRSCNVANFSLSSVECIQFPIKLENYENANDLEKHNRTILLLSCWDNITYLYDMNYNRCFFSLANSHDDAVSRVRLFNTKSLNSMFVMTSSWDSLIKLFHLKSSSKSSLTSNDLLVPNESIKVKPITELAHDSSVIDFVLSKKYLVSLCDDGNAYIWKLNVVKSNENESDPEEDGYYFNYFNSFQNDWGKITDCKIIETIQENNTMRKNSSNFYNINTIAFCTSSGYVKIFNIETHTELFTLRINLPQKAEYAKLNKLYYSTDYIMTIDSNGYIYFINLQQKSSSSSSSSSSVESDKNCFLTHTINLCSNCLQTLSIYKDFIVCVGDSEGYLYFLSIYDI